MICPQCNSEYKQGVFQCPECEVDLVNELSEESVSKFRDVKTVEVFSTFNLADVALIRSILDAEHIDHYFKGESSLYMVKPFVGQVKLVVKKSDEEKVRELLRDLRAGI